MSSRLPADGAFPGGKTSCTTSALAFGNHRSPDIGQGSDDPLVVPVVQDMFQQIHAGAAGNAMEHVTGNDLTAASERVPGKHPRGAGGHVRQIEQDAAKARMLFEDDRQQPPPI
jgi:hypothetical protein